MHLDDFKLSNSTGLFGLGPTGFLRLPEVLKLFPVSKSTWWQGIREGKFPQGVKLTPRTTAWRVADIKKLLEEVR